MRRCAAIALAVLLTWGPALTAQRGGDPVATLRRQIDAGTVTLTLDGESRYLRSLLKALNVPISSQSLVFVSGALQTRRVNANNPRALYFNDQVTVGWVRGGFVELMAQDPQRGLQFYSLEDRGLGKPALVPDGRCARCHSSARTGGIPALQVSPAQARPFEDRFGGWYVTGDSAPHFGNWDIWSAGPAPAGTKLSNLDSLRGRFDLTGYLSPYSDIVAQLVMQHRSLVGNAINRVHAKPESDEVEALVDRMLFVDELPLTAPVRGTSGFADEFQALGPRDRRGRSLRDLDLTTSLMRYPCSYLIYSPQFDALPAPAKAAIYKRLWNVLSGADRDTKYARLTAAKRGAVSEILRETKQGLPGYW